MDEEVSTLNQLRTLSLVTLPKGRKCVKTKCAFDLKTDHEGHIEQYKAWIFAKGFTQRHGVDYHEVLSPVDNYTTFRICSAYTTLNEWIVISQNIKNAFLNADNSMQIYVEQPKGYEQKNSRDKVYRLHKALLSLKKRLKHGEIFFIHF